MKDCLFMLKKMEGILGITIFLSCFLIAQSETIDITTLGAKAGGADIGPALLSAWDKACKSTSASKIVIPKGTFALKEVLLAGPCKAPIELQADGTVQGPADPKAMTEGKQWITIQYVEHFTLSGSGQFDGQGAQAWEKYRKSKRADNFSFNFVKHSTISGITSKDSKMFHMQVFQCENFTVSGVTIEAPSLSANTDGIHIAKGTGITIVDSIIKTGDDCVSIGDGAKQLKITGVTCGPGHGISVGSLGKNENEEPVEGVFVSNSTLINTDNGIRIKSWAASFPGKVSDIHFESIKMQNVSNPIVIDQLYCPDPPCKEDPPSKVQISKVSIKGISGTSATPLVAKIICSKSNPCQGVEIGDVDLSFSTAASSPLSVGLSKATVPSNCSNVQPTFVGKVSPKICSLA